jgi:hypothetical protein
MVALYDLQPKSCVEQCGRARKPSLNLPPTLLKEVSIWHMRILAGLSVNKTVPVDMDDSTYIDYGAAFTGSQDLAAIADDVLQAFLGFAQELESAPDEFFLGIWCVTFGGTSRACLCWRWVLQLLIDVSSCR